MKLTWSLQICILFILGACGNAKDLPDEAVRSISYTPSTEEGLSHFDHDDNISFHSLPLEGSVESTKKFWSGDHWPLNKGLINRRWNTPDQQGIETTAPTAEEVALLTVEEISRLSPSEKYDLYMGKYDYPLKKEVEGRIMVTAVEWEGIGNGWASASASHDEPLPTQMTNPEGIIIPFGSDDIKALLSYYYSFSKNLPTANHLGHRCSERDSSHSSEKCDNDLNAGSFHIALANRIGIKKMGFLADIDRYHEVWNHPFQSYRSEVLEVLPPSSDAPSSATRTLSIKTKVQYVDRSVGNSWNPVKGSFRQVTTNRVYRYDLHLNANDRIIGGSWRTNDRPDFIWTMPPVTEFDGYMSGLSGLLK